MDKRNWVGHLSALRTLLEGNVWEYNDAPDGPNHCLAFNAAKIGINLPALDRRIEELEACGAPIAGELRDRRSRASAEAHKEVDWTRHLQWILSRIKETDAAESTSGRRTSFVTEAWPRCVPDALLALARKNPDEVVGFRQEFGNKLERGGIKAFEYVAEIEERIARQSDGFFTVAEAAHVLANSRQGIDARQWAKDMQTAHCTGVLAIRHCGSRAPMRPCNAHPSASIPALWTASQDAARDYLDLVLVADIDEWLKARRVGYGFPPARMVNSEGHQSTPQETVQVKHLKRGPAQDAAILAAIRASGHDPKSIPKNPTGRPGVKAAIRHQVMREHPALFPAKGKTFDKAWDRLRSFGDVADKDG